MPSYGIAIRDNASGRVQRINDALAARGYAPALGEAVKLVVTDHFAAKEADPSTHLTAQRLGARPVGLFAQFVRATSWADEGARVLVSIAHPAIRQRLQGGEIKPVNKKALTIAANAAAYGKRAGEFKLQAVYFKNPQGRAVGMLIAPQDITEERQRKRRGQTKTISVTTQKAGLYYWLVKSVKQDPDPTVMPEDQAIIDGIMRALDGYFLEIT